MPEGKYLRVMLIPQMRTKYDERGKLVTFFHEDRRPDEYYIWEDFCFTYLDDIEELEKFADYTINEIVPILSGEEPGQVFVVMNPDNGAIEKDGWFWRGGFVHENDNEHFWKEVLGERVSCKPEPYAFKVRKLKLIFDTSDDMWKLLCTEPYEKDFNYLVENWPEMGLDALEPEFAQIHDPPSPD